MWGNGREEEHQGDIAKYGFFPWLFVWIYLCPSGPLQNVFDSQPPFEITQCLRAPESTLLLFQVTLRSLDYELWPILQVLHFPNGVSRSDHIVAMPISWVAFIYSG